MALRVDVITLFPEMFGPFVQSGVIRRAFDSGQAQLHLWQLRAYGEGAHQRVDDRTFGGGPGMVMLVEPLSRCLQDIRQARQAAGAPVGPVIAFSPAGQRLTQARVRELASSPGAILVCGRYEGVDQRFVDAHVDEEVSLGDYVLSGGELAAMALVDATCRLLPGVLGDAASHEQDSFGSNLLDCPHYSRPEHLGPDALQGGKGASADVPSVLMSGHHGRIAQWRRQQQLRLTALRRPDLIALARASGELSKEDLSFLQEIGL